MVSIIGCNDAGPNVPHFHNKHIAENDLRQQGVPFVSIRAGMFVDQGTKVFENNVREDHLPAIGDPEKVKISYITTPKLADALVEAMFSTSAVSNLVFDFGFREPLSSTDLLRILTDLTKRSNLSLKNMPEPKEGQHSEMFPGSAKDLKEMISFVTAEDGAEYRGNFSDWEQTFGPPPNAEDALLEWVRCNQLMQS